MNTDSIYIEILKESERLRIRERQVHDEINCRFEYVYPDMQMIEKRSEEIVDDINQSLFQLDSQISSIDQLQKLGQLLWDELLPTSFKNIFQTTTSKFLYLELDHQLLHIPWEILFDGKIFLCEKFFMGRSKILTKSVVESCKKRRIHHPLTMLMVTNSVSDLPDTLKEGKSIREIFDHVDPEHRHMVMTQKSNLSLIQLKEQVRDYDIIHYAGHAEYLKNRNEDSGLKCSDGIFKAADVLKMQKSERMPLMVFSNACQSARLQAINWDHQTSTIQNNSSGLAVAFILTGTKHYIGSFWKIMDKASRRFSELFYSHLIRNVTVGQTIHLTRKNFKEKYPTDISWASYVLYGDPKCTYPITPLRTTADEEFQKDSTTRTQEKSQNQETNFIPWQTDSTVRQFNWTYVLFFILFILAGILMWQFWRYDQQSNEMNPSLTDIHLNTIRSQLKIQLEKKQIKTNDLFQQYKSIVSKPVPEDNWTFGPLTLAMVFDSMMVHEKEALVLHAIQSQILLEIPSLVLVERQSFDKLLEELIRLGPQQSKLINPVLVLFLAIHLTDHQLTIVSMRLDDIEKGIILAMTDDIIHSDKPILHQKQALSQKIILILKNMMSRYPIRGRVKAFHSGEITLNIGENNGVAIDQYFKVVKTDTIVKVISVQQSESACTIVSGKLQDKTFQKVIQTIKGD